MDRSPDEKLDHLLREAYPALGVSPDFTLNLWRRLMKEPTRPPWMLPVPVLGLAAAIGVVAGIFSWLGDYHQVVRWDIFGNAPIDTVAGTYLQLTRRTT